MDKTTEYPSIEFEINNMEEQANEIFEFFNQKHINDFLNEYDEYIKSFTP